MARRWSWIRPVALVSLLTVVSAVTGCATSEAGGGRSDDETEASGGPTTDDGAPTLPASALLERPWEVVSKKNETFLADVFYADASENEQVMPWTIDGRAQIDRLIYPTLGNPNLYVKDDAEDELVTVLRLEENAYDHLAPKLTLDPANGPSTVKLGTNDDDDGIAFFLVAKNQRSAGRATTKQAPGPGIYAIQPSRITQNVEPAGMPARLKERHTLRFVFNQAAMKNVPPGLYDVRFEVRKNGALFANVFEYQYNAVRVFERESDEYTTLSVTDTQVSVGVEYKTLTADKLDDFVDGINASTDDAVRNAAFITFNGDLHNGGSPGTVRQRAVAKTYADEAKRIVGALSRLDKPIFLTPGNHDGYAAIGHAPGLVKNVDTKLGDSLEKVVSEQNNKPWPGFAWSSYAAFLDRTKDKPGGLPRDVFTGAFKRTVGESFASFEEVPAQDRNMPLYDGFYQWQKTYGPLHQSWTFGKNRYVSMNSFELRQHRRTGWGMYTVNYGGGMSKLQLEWFDRELARGKMANEDMIVLMHHDPRGGHLGKDLGYYPPVLDYRDIAQSTLNYIFSEQLVPLVCKQPEFSLSVDQRESCLHDGLQEWMGPDPDFEKEAPGYFMSGLELMKRFAAHAHARTLVLGHVHFNSLEVLREGEALVPNRLSLGTTAQQETATIEAANPVRRLAWEDTLLPTVGNARWRSATLARGSDPTTEGRDARIDTGLTIRSWDAWRSELDGILSRTPRAQRTLSAPMGEPRELAVIRFTSGSDLSSQTYDGQSMFGYSIMHVTKQVEVPRVNRLTYFVHAGVDAFDKVKTIDIDRTKTVATRDAKNPLEPLFDW